MSLARSARTTVRPTRIASVDGKLKLTGKDRGFTIIELLVVMAIIGLLAAIAIPVFSKLKNNAYDSAAQSDLRQVAIQTESVNTTTGSYPADTAGFTASVVPNVKLTSPNETVVYHKGATGFSASIVDSRTGNVFCYSSTNGGLTKVADDTTCAGLAG